MIEFEPVQLRLPEMKIAESRSFRFNPEKFEFILGNSKTKQSIKLSEIKDIFDLDTFTYKLKEDRENIPPNDSEMMLMALSCDLVAMPPLREWLSHLDSKEEKSVCEKTRTVIEKVYNETNEMKYEVKLSKGLQSSSNSSASVTIQGGGRFRLKTVGEWATLGHTIVLPPASISYISCPFEIQQLIAEDIRFPFELYFHNADQDNDKAKRLSLYAGAGTIAWLAKNPKTIY